MELPCDGLHLRDLAVESLSESGVGVDEPRVLEEVLVLLRRKSRSFFGLLGVADLWRRIDWLKPFFAAVVCSSIISLSIQSIWR